ncbi:hypothetical protein ACP70R_007092 [Stipagrostis hirtigluma subsp. patula]
MDAAPMLKRKGAEAPELCLDAGGAPATKIRRLDAEAPLVAPGAAAPPPQPTPFGVEEVPMCGDEATPAVAVGVAPAVNDERAIVVYQPADAARNLLLGPLRPGVPLRVNPDWIHGLRSAVLQEALFEALGAKDENPNLALVPWAPAQSAAAASTSTAPGAEMMDADQDGDGASMEVEHDGGVQLAPAAAVEAQGQAFHYHQQQPWPPQHCMEPQQLQLPAASYQPSPVTWTW